MSQTVSVINRSGAYVIFYTHLISGKCAGMYGCNDMCQIEKTDTSAKTFSNYKKWLLQDHWILSAFRLASLFEYGML